MDNIKLIEAKTVGAGGIATITFTSIPQTYTDLLLVHSLRESGGSATAQITFNNSTTSYGNLYFRGNGSTITSSTQVPTFIETFDNYSGSTASVFGSTSVYISNYTSSNNKSVSVDTVTENNTTTAYTQISASRWDNSAAITEIDITAGAGTFDQHSTAYLYGISNTTAGTGSAKATGGYVSEDSNYIYHTFLSSGTFTPTQSLTCDYLVIAGGGGAGYDGGGGGGAGGFRAFTSQSLSATAYAVTVGSGGAGSTSAGAKGSSGGTSTFNSNSSSGGGGGGSDASPAGNSGGSGGGGRVNRAGNTGGAGNSGGYSPAEGNAGGNGSSGGTASGGGGGAGASGNAGTTGDGGIGTNSYSSWASATLTGDQGYYAGGGGGTGPTGISSIGGLGGGANGLGGGVINQTAFNGQANTGGGGGANSGSGTVFIGGNGGSGLVIVRYAK